VTFLGRDGTRPHAALPDDNDQIEPGHAPGKQNESYGRFRVAEPLRDSVWWYAVVWGMVPSGESVQEVRSNRSVFALSDAAAGTDLVPQDVVDRPLVAAVGLKLGASAAREVLIERDAEKLRSRGLTRRQLAEAVDGHRFVDGQ
jgi:hypothetical protein